MQEFLDIVLAFPTVIFTVLLGISMVFWIMVIVGGVGGELLSVDVDLDVDMGSGLEFLSALGVGEVPMSIFAAVFVFWGWIISFFSVLLLQEMVDINLAIAAAILVGTTILSVPLTGAAVYPIRLLFREGDSGTETGNSLVGSECVITTNRVDRKFGRARCVIDDVEIVLNVRCHIDNDLRRNDTAYIIEYNDEKNSYRVKSHEAFFGMNESDDDKRFDFDELKSKEVAREVVEESSERSN